MLLFSFQFSSLLFKFTSISGFKGMEVLLVLQRAMKGQGLLSESPVNTVCLRVGFMVHQNLWTIKNTRPS